MNTELLKDPSRPVSRIADVLEPYLKELEKSFHPQHVILFGSYAYGNPGQDSDVDMLVITRCQKSPLDEAKKIRKAWRPLRKSFPPPSIDLIVETPEGHLRRTANAAGFYDEINRKGLHLS